MKLRLMVVALFAAAQLEGQNFINTNVQPADAASGVAQAMRRVAPAGEAWVAWVVPGIAGRSVCCWNGSSCCGTCSLAGGSGFSSSDADDPGMASSLVVVVRMQDGVARRIRLFDTNCQVDGGGATIHVLANVSAEASIDWLLSQLDEDSSESNVLAAVAMHEHQSVTPRLIALARGHERSEVRRHALFWLGQKAGAKVAGELRRAVDEDPDADVREHAVFAIAQLPADRAVPMLIELVKTHKSPGVRKKAMFWLAQTNHPQALQTIEDILMP